MKRTLIPLLSIFMSVLLFGCMVMGCAPTDETPHDTTDESVSDTTPETLDPDIQPMLFAYRLDAPDGYAPGNSVHITTYMTNIIDRPLSYVGSSNYQEAYFYVYYFDEDGQKCILDLGAYSCTDDYNPYTVEPGQTTIRKYYVHIPKDAPATTYHMVVHCTWNEAWFDTFENVFTIPAVETATDTAASVAP